MAGACVFGVVINKLSRWLNLDLIVLLKIDKSFKISFYGTILRFCLAMSLQMEGNKKSTLNIKKVAEQ